MQSWSTTGPGSYLIIGLGGWALGPLWLFIVAPLVGGAYQALHLPVPTVLTLAEAQQTLRG